MEKTVLTVSMLVSGREKTTQKSLMALQPLREILGAEIILTDTGCTSEYLKEIRPYADKILEFAWCKDFAKARNVGLFAANSEWFMFIDDDEWFEDVTPIIEFFQSGEYRDYHQAVYLARNYQNMEGTSYIDEWVSRLIRIEEDTHFEGSVHECLMPVRGKCKQIPAFVHHYGYVFETEEERVAHYKRNTEILEHLLRTEPNNMKWSLQLLKEYYSVGDFEKLRNISNEALQKIEAVDETFMNMCRGAFYISILMSDVHALDDEMMWQHYLTFAENPKNPWNVRGAMAAFMLLQAPMDEEIDTNNKKLFEICANEYKNALAEHEQQMYSEQDEIIADSIVFVKEYLNMLPEYTQNIKNSMVQNGEFLLLPDRAWTLAELGVLPLEDMILELPFSQWVVQIHVFQTQGYSATWGKVAEHLAAICTRNDIRYIYFDRVLETIKMRQVFSLPVNIEKMDYETMTQILMDFAQANLNYMDYMYTEMAFEGEMELFSPEEKAALWIANGFAMDNSQWKEKLRCFGEVAKICPMLGDFIKRYIHLFGQELTKG